MKKHSLRFLTLFLIGVLIHSCQKDDDFIELESEKINDTENPYSYGEKVILGKQLENPFSIENMKM